MNGKIAVVTRNHQRDLPRAKIALAAAGAQVVLAGRWVKEGASLVVEIESMGGSAITLVSRGLGQFKHSPTMIFV